MLTPGPVDVVAALLLSLRRFGPGRTLLGALVVGVGIQPLLPPVACGCFRPLLRRCDNGYRVLAPVKSDLKNLASQQEILYAELLRYSADPVELAFVHSDGVDVTILADERGWTAWASHASTAGERGCAVTYGEALEPGPGAPDWVDVVRGVQPGEVACS